MEKIDGIEIISPENINNYIYDEIIIASQYKNEIKKQLVEELGIEEYKIKTKSLEEISFVEDTFENRVYKFTALKNYLKNNKGKIFLFGTGIYAKNVHRLLNLLGISIKGFIDNNLVKNGQSFCGREILSLLDLSKYSTNDIYIIVAEKNGQYEIEKQLLAAGYLQNTNFISITDYTESPDIYWNEILYKMSSNYGETESYDYDNLKKYICIKPFSQLILFNPFYCTCCASFLEPIAKVSYSDYHIENIWNSKQLCDFRKSIIDGTYQYCDEKYCPYKKGILLGNQCSYFISNDKQNNSQLNEIVNVDNGSIKKGPSHLTISFDDSCNLHCIMCRKESISEKSERLEKITNYLCNGIFPDLERIDFDGAGEVFFSKYYLRVLKSINSERFPALKNILIRSNGVLFTEEKWNEMSNIHNYNIEIAISIDAAKKETYDRIRLNGDFQKVCDNLYWLSEKRKNNDIKYFQVDFCVQRENFREMKEFIDFSNNYNVDKISFQKLFSDKFGDLLHLNGNKYYQEFLQLINDEYFKDPKVCMQQFVELIH